MLAQTTFFIALMTAIVLGVLTTNLISAGVARDHEIAKYTTLASDDAVDNFVSLMQSYVKEHGTEGPWPTAIPASAPIALCPDGSCPYTYTIDAKITGASGMPSGTEANDTAINLQRLLVNEARISATVETRIVAQSINVASDSRFITLRVFEAPPFIMVSGQHDIVSKALTQNSLEGDNGGVVDGRSQQGLANNPTSSNPNTYHRTDIMTTLNCIAVDRIIGSQTANPSHNQGRGNRQLPWGVGIDGGYELPCTDKFATPSPGKYESESWTNGNASNGTTK